MLRVLVLAPRLNKEGVGEVRNSFEMLEALAPLVKMTVLAFENRKASPLAQQLPGCEVVTFPEPSWTRRSSRFLSMLKPEVVAFNRLVYRWVRDSGRQFDIAHQILPAAPRYPTALRHLDIPYVIGSVGGALRTPEGFRSEVEDRWFTRLRGFDNFRFRHDPWLRRSFARAELVLGVAPYMADVLKDLEIRRFEPFLRLGVSSLKPPRERTAKAGELRLLHVGRAVRTKGLRDVVRALAELKDLPGVTLTSIGGGEEIEFCRAEAERLGVADRVTFLGQMVRADIEAHYRDSEAFIFPSFRESMGGVLYEAMNWSLPVITTNRGGPDHIVDESCGLKVAAETPEQLKADLAVAIRALAVDPELRLRLGENGRKRLEEKALWSAKAKKLVQLYEEILADAPRLTG